MVSSNVVPLFPTEPSGGQPAPAHGAASVARSAPERRWPWLLTSPDATKWIVRDGPGFRLEESGEERTATIDFGFRLPDGTRLTDPKNAHLLRLAMRYAVLVREHETSKVQSAALHVQQVRYFFMLLAWMRLQEEPILHVADLRRTDVNRFALAAKFGTAGTLDVVRRLRKLVEAGFDVSDTAAVRRALHLSDQLDIKDEIAAAVAGRDSTGRKPLVHNPIFRQLLVLEDLWAFRRDIDGDKIRFDPFETSASAEAAKHCSETGRTPVIPQRQAMVLIDGCIRVLVEVGPVVERLRDVLADAVSVEGGRKAREQAAERRLAEHAREVEELRARVKARADASAARVVEDATVLVAQACFVLIAALSARRHEEIATLRTGCIVGEDGGLFVYSAILKTERENQLTPIPDLVSRAVAWLTRIGLDARAAHGVTRLFAWADATSFRETPRLRTTLPTDFARLADVCGVPPHEGAVWRFTPRQFRRFFAILYMWRHHNPDLGALRHHLRHWDFSRTRAYCTDQSLGRIFTSEQRAFTRTIVTEAVTGARRVGGAAGGRLMAMAGRLKGKYAGVVAMDPERLVSWAERIADRMVVRCNPWSYCTCPDTRRGAKDANCRSGADAGAVGADLANATPETCIDCRHCMTDPVFTPFMRTEIAQGERAMSTKAAAGTVFAAATARRLAVIRAHVAAADAEGAPA